MRNFITGLMFVIAVGIGTGIDAGRIQQTPLTVGAVLLLVVVALFVKFVIPERQPRQYSAARRVHR